MEDEKARTPKEIEEETNIYIKSVAKPNKPKPNAFVSVNDLGKNIQIDFRINKAWLLERLGIKKEK